MLDGSLQQAVRRDAEYMLSVPRDWKMSEKKLTKVIGVVEPAAEVHWINSVIHYPNLYRNLFIENPNLLDVRMDGC